MDAGLDTMVILKVSVPAAGSKTGRACAHVNQVNLIWQKNVPW